MKASTAKSAALSRQARRLMPGGVSSPVRSYPPYPRCIARGNGAYLWDVDGTRYVDLCLGFGPLLLGHAHPAVTRAVRAQAGKGTVYGAPCEDEPWVARRLRSLYPSLERVRFVSTGGEAITSVLRLARGFTGKPGVVKIDGGFHGSVDQLLVKAGSGAATFPSSSGVVASRDLPTYLVPFNDAAAIRSMLEDREDIGLVLLEPALGNMGLLLPEAGYLRELRRITRKAGVLLAFDEVITGFRVALGGAQERWEVVPDLTVLGKVLGGGLPLAAYGGREEIMSLVAPEGPVYQAGTFSGNPLSMAASRAVLETLSRPKLRDVERRTQALAQRLRDTFASAGVEAQVPTVGSILSIFLSPRTVRNADDARASEGKRYLELARGLLEGGVFVPQSPFESLFLSTSHDDAAVDRVVDALRLALRSGGA